MGEGFLLDCNRRRGHIWFVINSAAPARLSYISKDHFSAEWSSELHTHGWTELNSCLDLMLQESSESLAGHEAACQHLLEVLLIRLGRQQAMSLSGEAPGPGPRASQECEFIRRYIDNHFKEDLTLHLFEVPAGGREPGPPAPDGVLPFADCGDFGVFLLELLFPVLPYKKAVPVPHRAQGPLFYTSR